MISLLYEEQMFFGFPKINLKRKDFMELLCYHRKCWKIFLLLIGSILILFGFLTKLISILMSTISLDSNYVSNKKSSVAYLNSPPVHSLHLRNYLQKILSISCPNTTYNIINIWLRQLALTWYAMTASAEVLCLLPSITCAACIPTDSRSISRPGVASQDSLVWDL